MIDNVFVFFLEVNCLAKSKDDGLRRTAPRVTIPEPELTSDKKFRCPIDQVVYSNRKDYDAHCKEEHDVL
jgi:hypothetical protein